MTLYDVMQVLDEHMVVRSQDAGVENACVLWDTRKSGFDIPYDLQDRNVGSMWVNGLDFDVTAVTIDLKA